MLDRQALPQKGMETFLTDRVPGYHETFYAHAMRWYYPSSLKRTYSKYGLVVGIYSMEGFKAINFMKNVRFVTIQIVEGIYALRPW